VFGAGGGTSSYREVEETEVLFLWGANARENHPIFFHHVLKAVHRGARLYAVDPRRTTSAQWADRWLGVHVGSDIALANAMARVIIHAGLADERFIKNATSGYDEYRKCVEAYPLDRAERLTGSRPRPSRKRHWRTRKPIAPSSAGPWASPSTTTRSTTCWR